MAGYSDVNYTPARNRPGGCQAPHFLANDQEFTMTRRLHCMAILLLLFVCCCPTAQPQSCTPAPSGLVSWWSGDTNENDIIGGNNPDTVAAVTLVAGEAKNGFTFGNEGYISIPPASNLANQQFTWTAWVRPDGPGPNDDAYGSVIVEQNIDSIHASVWLSWGAPEGRFVFGFGNLYSELISSTDKFPAGSFYLVAGTYNGTTFQLSVNGVPEGSVASVKTVAYSAQGWFFGSNPPLYFPSLTRRWSGSRLFEVPSWSPGAGVPQRNLSGHPQRPGR